MAALLVAMSVMAVLMSVALPVWSTAAKRAREDELVFRGEQYARAIALYQRKYANALPPSIDVLVNERFLRRKYLDPVTGGEFQPLTGAVGQAGPGVGGTPTAGGPGTGGAAGRAATQTGAGTGRGGATSTAAATGIGRGAASAGAGFTGRQGGAPLGGTVGAAGGIVGVASKSTEKSLRLYNGRGAYNEWTFIAQQRTLQAGEGAAGSQTPGGVPGRGRAGERGAGAGRPAGAGPGSFRPPSDSFRPTGADGRGFRPGGR
jgi:type II secretory pathway pseudopilin PulG